MSDKNYILEIVKVVYPSLRMVKKSEASVSTAIENGVIYRLSVDGGGERLELELHLGHSKIRVTSLFPYYGIVSHGPFLTPREDPVNHGFMDSYGDLTQKGAYFLFLVLRDVLNVYEVALCCPNAILGLYTLCFQSLSKRDPSLKFGRVELKAGSALTKSLGRVVKERCGFEVGWSVDLFHSFQDVVVNHPEIFRGNLN